MVIGKHSHDSTGEIASNLRLERLTGWEAFDVIICWKVPTEMSSSIHELNFGVYHEARQSSQLFSPDRFRCFLV